MPFGVPMVWSVPSNHSTDCYFCMVPSIQNGISKKKKPTLVYPNIPSAIRPVPHGDGLPVPEPPDNFALYSDDTGTAVTQWLRCCATNRKVAGSIPAGVIGFFIDIKSFQLHYSPGVDLPSNKWVPGAFPGGKGGRCARLTTYHHPVPLSRNLGTLTSWNPLGHSGSVMGLRYLSLWRHGQCFFKQQRTADCLPSTHSSNHRSQKASSVTSSGI